MIICVLDNFDLTHLSIVTWIHVRECNCMFHSSLLSFHLFPSHSHCVNVDRCEIQFYLLYVYNTHTYQIYFLFLTIPSSPPTSLHPSLISFIYVSSLLPYFGILSHHFCRLQKR